MAIYRSGEDFYINGLAGLAGNSTSCLHGHRFSRESFQLLTRIYSTLLMVQILFVPVVIWLGLRQKIWHQALHMNWVNLLAIFISSSVLAALLATLLLRKELNTFDSGTSTVEKSQSCRYYSFYALSSLNLLILLASAPWGPGWHVPADVLAPGALILLLLLGCLYRLVQVRSIKQP